MEQAVPNVVGPSVRKKRYALGMTQEMLAARCSVLGYEITRSTLAKIESQVRGISDVELFAIAKALKVPMESLFPKGFN